MTPSRSGRPPPASAERGTATVLATAVVAVVMLLALLVGDVGLYLAGRARAVTAADAAALAAAPLTFHGFGSGASPAAEADRFAGFHGMAVVACDCAVDRSWAARTVTVVVSGEVELLVVGTRSVSARASAEFDPVELAADQPGTITRRPPEP